jgi:hypothetical protein
MYRSPTSTARSGPGISADGYNGAESFFEQVTRIGYELKIPGMPTPVEQAAAAKSAVDAYMSAKNGLVSSNEAFFQEGKVPGDFPQVDIKADVSTGLNDASSPLTDVGKAVTDLMSHMGDMLNQMISAPMGILGAFLGFLVKLFTDIAEGIGQALSEAAQAIASAVEDVWKKQMEVVSSAASQSGLQPLELYNQAATTQILSHALRNGAST